ncbi:MAG: hypothetical protein JKX84_02905 [Flavobacteriales bacterium]|nr:hypothetical protein [Flavobacteriales bacterium]
MSKKEILTYKGQDFCGIFNSNQLDEQKPLSRYAQMMFSILTVLPDWIFGKTCKSTGSANDWRNQSRNAATSNKYEQGKSSYR